LEYNSQFPNTGFLVSEYHFRVSEYHCPVSEHHFAVSEYHFQFPNPSFRIPPPVSEYLRDPCILSVGSMDKELSFFLLGIIWLILCSNGRGCEAWSGRSVGHAERDVNSCGLNDIDMLGVCAKPDVEVLLGSAEARVRELQLLCEETSQRIHSAKAAAQRWRQIAITLQLRRDSFQNSINFHGLFCSPA